MGTNRRGGQASPGKAASLWLMISSLFFSACAQAGAVADATPMVPIIVFATPATPEPEDVPAPPAAAPANPGGTVRRRSRGPVNTTPLPRSTGAATAGGASPGATDCQTTMGTLQADAMPSTVLNGSLTMRVYLPACYDAAGPYRYPTVYLLPGLGAERNPWIAIGITQTLDTLIAEGKVGPMVVVFPDTDESAGEQSRFVYSGAGAGSWEDFIVREMLPWIEAKYHVRTDAGGRGIGGISRGGYWSVEIGLRHPELFSAVGGHSPSISPDMLIGVTDDFAMISLATSLTESRSQRYFLDSGDGDPMQYPVEKLGQALVDNQISTISVIGKGGHDEFYWESQATNYITFYGANWR